ncbi:hypothetical protein G7Y89_g9849 [Cudoniella acicularis]|uniref:Uncharacterized protein n=1 Tax=Cudoniella acicularis TaxID=354080 RepID=A0A8H4RGM3_9HELO|nr:hypothetical protein G7Y89_g9849 [Cudoniella acicularis]
MASPSSSRPAKATLESLVPELKCAILRRVDITGLYALVHASPLYYTIYVSQRKDILLSTLLNDLDRRGLFIATSLHQCLRLHHMAINHGNYNIYHDLWNIRKPIMWDFLTRHASPPTTNWQGELDGHTVTELFRQHGFIQGAISQYAIDKPPINPITRESSGGFQRLSWSESTRLYRAFYHFELYCQLYASHRLSDKSRFHQQQRPLPPSERLTGQIALHMTESCYSRYFLPTLFMWESEEVASVRKYLFDYYGQMLQRCAGELSQLENSPPNPDAVYARLWPRGFTTLYPSEKIEYWISLGL